MALVINGNLDIQGSPSVMKLPLDFRYGPWNNWTEVQFWLNNPEILNDRTYYGLTIGMKVFDNSDPPNVIGVDEYWWQPNCVYDSQTNSYVDGFIRKYPANTPQTVTKDGDMVLALNPGETLYGAEWRDDEDSTPWHSLSDDSSTVVNSENP